jgi:dTDP-4-dehydrorhamnose 3,5-epimerase
METYRAPDFAAAGIWDVFVQDNHSRSARGILRGLHLQKTHPQAKLVRCIAGAVWDVAVDVSPASPAFGRWFGIELSAANKRQLYIPAGSLRSRMVPSLYTSALPSTTRRMRQGSCGPTSSCGWAGRSRTLAHPSFPSRTPAFRP